MVSFTFWLIVSKLLKNDWSVAPYVVNGRKWFGFDDEYSIANKSQYILDMGLGGGMIWSVDTDDYKGFCGKKFGVLATMNQVLNGGPQTPPPGLSTNPILLPFLLSIKKGSGNDT